MASDEKALVPESTRLAVSGDFIAFADALNVSGAYSALRENDAYARAKDELAGLVSGLAQRAFNEHFHKNLNFFEKMGFLSKRKWAEHQQKISLLGGVTDFGVRCGIDLVFAWAQMAREKREFEGLVAFSTGALAYVNKEPSVAVRRRVEKFYLESGRGFDVDRFRIQFMEHAGQSVAFLPGLPGVARERPESLFVTLLAACDLGDPATKDRAGELGELLGISRPQIEHLLDVTGTTGAVVSDVTGVAGLTLQTVFLDLLRNVDQAREGAVYSIENDPYHAVRVGRKDLVLKGGVVAAAAAATLAAGPVGDMLIAGATPVILNFMSGGGTAKEALEVHKRFAELKRAVPGIQRGSGDGK